MPVGSNHVACPGCGRPSVEVIYGAIPNYMWVPEVAPDGSGSAYVTFGCWRVAGPDRFCTVCAVAFYSTEADQYWRMVKAARALGVGPRRPSAFRRLRESPSGWVEVGFPERPVSDQLRKLFGQVGEDGYRVVSTEETVIALLPPGITHDYWWKDHPCLLVVGSDSEALRRSLEDDSTYLLEAGGTYPVEPWGRREMTYPDASVWRDDVIRSARHVSSWLNPAGLLALVSPDGAKVYRPPISRYITDEDPLTNWNPVGPVVIFGHSRAGTNPVLCLESRLKTLAEVWAAVTQHDTWQEISGELSEPAKEFLLYTESENESVQRVSEVMAELRDAWEQLREADDVWHLIGDEIPRSVVDWFESWSGWDSGEPWPGFPLSRIRDHYVPQDGFSWYPLLDEEKELRLVEEAVDEVGSSAISDAIAAGEIDVWASMHDGDYFTVIDAEAIKTRLKEDRIPFRDDQPLIEAAAGPWWS